MWKKILFSPWTKRCLFVICLIPAAMLIWRGFTGDLSANPVEFIEHKTGDWALRFLLITLAVTPLRKIFEQPLLTRFRRMLGLFAFFYACVHLLMYLTFDQMFRHQRNFRRRLEAPLHHGRHGWVSDDGPAGDHVHCGHGAAAWDRSAGSCCIVWYIFATLAGVIHYYWLVKSDVREPLMYGGILLVLMLFRVRLWTAKKPPSATAVPSRATTAQIRETV